MLVESSPVATRPLPQFEIADDLDEAAVTEFGNTLNDFTRELGALLELNQEASLALRAAATLSGAADDASALGQGENISDESGCAERLLADAPPGRREGAQWSWGKRRRSSYSKALRARREAAFVKEVKTQDTKLTVIK